jgi:hypothetical protein
MQSFLKNSLLSHANGSSTPPLRACKENTELNKVAVRNYRNHNEANSFERHESVGVPVLEQ